MGEARADLDSMPARRYGGAGDYLWLCHTYWPGKRVGSAAGACRSRRAGAGSAAQHVTVMVSQPDKAASQ